MIQEGERFLPLLIHPLLLTHTYTHVPIHTPTEHMGTIQWPALDLIAWFRTLMSFFTANDFFARQQDFTHSFLWSFFLVDNTEHWTVACRLLPPLVWCLVQIVCQVLDEFLLNSYRAVIGFIAPMDLGHGSVCVHSTSKSCSLVGCGDFHTRSRFNESAHLQILFTGRTNGGNHNDVWIYSPVRKNFKPTSAAEVDQLRATNRRKIQAPQGMQ